MGGVRCVSAAAGRKAVPSSVTPHAPPVTLSSASTPGPTHLPPPYNRPSFDQVVRELACMRAAWAGGRPPTGQLGSVSAQVCPRGLITCSCCRADSGEGPVVSSPVRTAGPHVHTCLHPSGHGRENTAPYFATLLCTNRCNPPPLTTDHECNPADNQPRHCSFTHYNCCAFAFVYVNIRCSDVIPWPALAPAA